ncbi:hypothetical protein ACLMJK_004768 [Lecanora helva]
MPESLALVSQSAVDATCVSRSCIRDVKKRRETIRPVHRDDLHFSKISSSATSARACMRKAQGFQDGLMAEASEKKIAFHFTTSISTSILTDERLAPITVSLEGLDMNHTAGEVQFASLSVMASLMSADGRVPMALVDQNIFGGRTFSTPRLYDGQLLFEFDDLVIRQSGNFRIQFALIEREDRDGQGDTTPRAPTAPLSRHTEVIHVSPFVRERTGGLVSRQWCRSS